MSDLSSIRKLSAEAREAAENLSPSGQYWPAQLFIRLANLLDRLTDEGALERMRKAISDDIDAHINGEPWDGRSAALAALNALLAEDGQ